MTKRREFIRKSIIGSVAVAFGGFVSRAGSNASDIEGVIVSKQMMSPVVEAEEVVYEFLPADNGAGPMWCAGSSSLVREGDKVFASGLETVPDWLPLNNCRWMLFERTDNGWKKMLTDETGRTREPSPMAIFHDGHFFLSANPTLTSPEKRDGPARPEMLRFNGKKNDSKFERMLPVWDGDPPFSEHSYRSLASDGKAGELILFQNIGYTHAEWSYLDSKGKWSSQGKLEWPFGYEYEVPEPIRVCYPNVMVKDRAVYFCGVSDIIEPRKEWRDYKREITGREWDYDFRRLFFTWSNDIKGGKFHPWIEIASREETCGWIFPADLWVDTEGLVHLMWIERAIDERLREKFFPEAKQSHALNYAVVRDGKVEIRRTIVLAEEGVSNEIPGSARFQVTPDNRLFVVCFIKGSDKSGLPVAENRLIEIKTGGNLGTPVILPLKQPLSSFFTATVRAGSKPSLILDMLGTPHGVKNTINYARIHLK